MNGEFEFYLGYILRFHLNKKGYDLGHNELLKRYQCREIKISEKSKRTLMVWKLSDYTDSLKPLRT